MYWLAVAALVLILAACSSGAESSPVPTPPEATSEVPGSTPVDESTTLPMNGELDLSGLPDGPTELMLATFDQPFDLVSRKMAYSGNQTYIPVLLEFLRFLNDNEDIITMTSYLSRLKDNMPPEEIMVFPEEQKEWNWWI